MNQLDIAAGLARSPEHADQHRHPHALGAFPSTLLADTNVRDGDVARWRKAYFP
jgi:hypothetical protein